jgi:hypothetical protein
MLREEHRLEVSQNRMLRTTPETLTDEAGDNVTIISFKIPYCSPRIIRIIKPKWF